jgi:hypothetical protein
MLRITGPLFALVFAAVLNGPSLYLLQFTVRKAYIERELCVQRDVMEGMRTCHGECQLSKKFRALEEQADASFPAERLQIRTEPMMPFELANRDLLRASSPLFFRAVFVGTSAGHLEVCEPVPWG